jgi:hypothetical protein
MNFWKLLFVVGLASSAAPIVIGCAGDTTTEESTASARHGVVRWDALGGTGRELFVGRGPDGIARLLAIWSAPSATADAAEAEDWTVVPASAARWEERERRFDAALAAEAALDREEARAVVAEIGTALDGDLGAQQVRNGRRYGRLQSCENGHLDALHGQQVSWCHRPRTCANAAIRSCTDASARLANGRQCFELRRRLIRECFYGRPDPNHAYELASVQTVANQCRNAAEVMCGGGRFPPVR